jgi:hypothetical protein
MYTFYSFLTSALDGGEQPASRPGRPLPPGIDPGTHWIGGWVGLVAGLDTEVKEKFFAFAGIQTLVVQSVVRHFTAWITASSNASMCILEGERDKQKEDESLLRYGAV